MASDTWRTDEPPAPGWYLVTFEVRIFDNQPPKRSTGWCWWEDGAWLSGGYRRVVGWMELPEPMMS